jgi:mRNA interferase MazF
MAIAEHPAVGTVLTCDFNTGFEIPEMVKNRPVVVISPKIANRPGLCTVVSLSTDPPAHVMPYHRQIDISPKLPTKWDSDGVWIKGDMVYAVAFRRLNFLSHGKGLDGKRIYHYATVSDEHLKEIRACVLRAIGLSALTKHL